MTSSPWDVPPAAFDIVSAMPSTAVRLEVGDVRYVGNSDLLGEAAIGICG